MLASRKPKFKIGQVVGVRLTKGWGFGQISRNEPIVHDGVTMGEFFVDGFGPCETKDLRPLTKREAGQ